MTRIDEHSPINASQRELLVVCRDAGRPMTPAEIAQRLPGQTGFSIRPTLMALHRRGHLAKFGGATPRYQITAHGIAILLR